MKIIGKLAGVAVLLAAAATAHAETGERRIAKGFVANRIGNRCAVLRFAPCVAAAKNAGRTLL
jgi:hypothetical protein